MPVYTFDVAEPVDYGASVTALQCYDTSVSMKGLAVL